MYASRLNNTEVKERDARIAACLKPSIFNAALATIRNALSDYYADVEAERRAQVYEKIIRSYKIPRVEFVRAQMTRVVEELAASAQLRRKYKGRLEEGDDVVSVAVFYWTCDKLRIRKVRPLSIPTWPLLKNGHRHFRNET